MRWYVWVIPLLIVLSFFLIWGYNIFHGLVSPHAEISAIDKSGSKASVSQIDEPTSSPEVNAHDMPSEHKTTPKPDKSRAASTPDINTRTSRTVDDIDFAAYSKDLAKFVGLAEGQSRGEAIDNVRLYFAPEDGAAIIQTSQSSFDLPDGAVLLFSAAGLPDDSVKAEEIYLILSGEKGAQKLAAYGSRIKCHRGENTTDWQNTLCP